jgi:RimJ/RimL family protein N-acetyltransferase
MDPGEFAALHVPALEADEVRFNALISAIVSAKNGPEGFRRWTLGAAGHCAVQRPGREVQLGNLDEAECRELARATAGIDYSGVSGSGETPRTFVEQATALGARFEDPIPLRIHILSGAPRYPGAPGAARQVTAADAPLLLEWMTAFRREALPHDPPLQPSDAEKAAAGGRFFFWTVEEKPVSMAALMRRLRQTGAISAVYTPPGQRGRGYAGSVTAAVAERIFAEGRRAACLHTDLRNPVSNRCYARIGFTPHCEAWHHVRNGRGPTLRI